LRTVPILWKSKVSLKLANPSNGSFEGDIFYEIDNLNRDEQISILYKIRALVL
jgi:hypothetical protein